MRDMIDLKNAFGQADDSFVNNVYNTLAGMQTNESRKPVKKIGFRLLAAIVIAFMLSCGTVLAFTNTWGILDFLRERWNGVKVLPEAAEMVQKDVSQKGSQTEFAAFVVREAVFDGKNIFIVVDAKPSSPEYLLLGPDAYPSDPISNMGPLFSDKTGTIADYAQENNKKMINTSVGISGANCSIDYLLEDDGTLVYMINCSYSGNSAKSEIQMTCVAVPFVNWEGRNVIDMSNKKVTTLSVMLKNSGTMETVTSTMPAVYSDCGVRVDKVTLTGSPMAIYADIEYTVIDKKKFDETDGGLWFEFVDETGNCLPSGVSSGEGIIAVGEDHFIQKVTLQASKTLPGKIILRGYNSWDKNRYETHTFEMK
ncbi:MAG TPA: hypothetical protein GXX36_07190 [Clostridiaceae bacterium]|nr:hypothetical protein [Clostridiaceae bacterium]